MPFFFFFLTEPSLHSPVAQHILSTWGSQFTAESLDSASVVRVKFTLSAFGTNVKVLTTA